MSRTPFKLLNITWSQLKLKKLSFPSHEITGKYKLVKCNTFSIFQIMELLTDKK